MAGRCPFLRPLTGTEALPLLNHADGKPVGGTDNPPACERQTAALPVARPPDGLILTPNLRYSLITTTAVLININAI
jgi:hypothetical protein